MRIKRHGDMQPNNKWQIVCQGASEREKRTIDQMTKRTGNRRLSAQVASAQRDRAPIKEPQGL